MLISMLLNDDIADIEKAELMCMSTFVVDEFTGLFLHPSAFSIKHSRPAKIISGALSYFLYRSNSNIFVSLEGIIILQKSFVIYFPMLFYAVQVFFCCERIEEIQTIKITLIFKCYSSEKC